MDLTLARTSDDLLLLATVAYSVALVALTVEWAFGDRGRVGRTASALTAAARVPVAAGAVGAGGAGAPPARLDVPVQPERGTLAARAGAVGVALTGVGWVVHLASLVTRGVAVERVPWANMYEFSSATAFVAVSAYGVLLLRRYPVRHLGAFVLLPVVVALGVAATYLYAEAGPLVPALQSGWLPIHVTAAVLAFGVFGLAAVLQLLFLLRDRWETRAAAAGGVASGLGARLPGSLRLDRLSYRVVAVGFPIWTFAIIAGAVWAREAWTRPWAWDPKEVWSFVSWVLYAAYLHARATAGWRGRRAAVVGLVAFGSMLFNYFAVNILFSGLHSYGGV